jgi:hypothetical protein
MRSGEALCFCTLQLLWQMDTIRIQLCAFQIPPDCLWNNLLKFHTDW